MRIFRFKGNAGKANSNFFYLILEEIFYYTANAFFDTVSIIPVFVDMLTGNLKLAALSASLRNAFFILPQLVMGLYTYKLKDLPSFMRNSAFITRVFVFAFIVLFAAGSPLWLLVLTFMLVCALLGTGDGLINVPWLDFIGRVVPKDRRGKLFAYILLLGGIGAMLGGFVIKYIFSAGISMQLKYSLIFGLGGLFLMGSTFSFNGMRDTEREKEPPPAALIRFFRLLPQYLFKNRDFSKLMLVLVLNYFSNLALPLYVVFARRILNLNDSDVGTLIYSQIVGIIIGGGAWGYLSYRFGDKTSVQVTVLTNIALPALSVAAFLSGLNTYGFLLFVIVSFGSGAASVGWPGFINYVISCVPDSERPVYIGLLNTLTLPLSFLTLLGGVLAEKTGYVPVFAVVSVLCGLSFINSFKLRKI